MIDLNSLADIIWCERLQKDGITYQAEGRSSRDANIIMRSSVPSLLPMNQDHTAARILAIFKKASDEQIFVIAAPHVPLSESDLVHDKYRQFGIVGGRLYYEQTAAPIVIRATQLITLFAATPFECALIGVPVVHVLPLYKVRHAMLSSKVQH